MDGWNVGGGSRFETFIIRTLCFVRRMGGIRNGRCKQVLPSFGNLTSDKVSRHSSIIHTIKSEIDYFTSQNDALLSDHRRRNVHTCCIICILVLQETKPFAKRQYHLLIFHFLNSRCSMRMPLGDLPIRCCSRTIRSLGHFNRFSIRFLPLFPLLRLFGFLRLLVLLVVSNQSRQIFITMKG